MVKVINFSDKIKKTTWADKAMEALNSMPDADSIVKVIVQIIVKECEAGLGLVDLGDDSADLQFFELIHDVYQRKAGDCYFCQDNDPNEVPFTKKSYLCFMCRRKLANFLTFIGIDAGKIIAGVR